MEKVHSFIRPSQGIDSDNPAVMDLARKVTFGQENPVRKAVNLFYWVRDEISYTPLVPLGVFENYRASDTLRRGKGFCVEKGALLAATARSVGIPARLRLADIRNHIIPERLADVMHTDVFACHGLTELYLNGKWTKATPAFDIKMCHENGFGPVEFDGIHDAVFSRFTVEGKIHIEYIKDRGYFEDVPTDYILETWMKIYGAESLDRLNSYLEDERARNWA